jgi:hypothetical protein
VGERKWTTIKGWQQFCVVCALLTGTGELLMWTVWVGGSELNWQHYTHKIDAERVAEFWREVKGYDDVVVEQVA